MRIGVPKEVRPGEHRVALIPEAVKRLVGKGHDVLVQQGAGVAAGWRDADYTEAGATVVATADEVWAAELVTKVQRPAVEEKGHLRSGLILVAMLQHLAEPAEMTALAATGVTSLAMDWMPRSTRAQDMDARSSMSTIQGYKAVLMAADALPRFMPMLMTAAGTVAPAQVLVIGAGVAGLSAIATARRLGGQVEGFDVRPATREQVESLGARFLPMDMELEDAQDEQGYAKAQDEKILELERQTFAKRLPTRDIVISTALVPGQQPPLLLTADMVATMRPGSVIVDLAAAFGGNCEHTVAGASVVRDGVTIIGYTDLESRVAFHASQMYARNISNYLLHLLKDGAFNVEADDELVRFPLITHGGRVVAPGIGGGS